MAAKQWYSVEVECIKFNPSLTVKVGEKTVVAKVKSSGLAYSVASHLIRAVYPTEYFKVSVK